MVRQMARREGLMVGVSSGANVSAALANIEPAMEQAAANLGASRFTIFRKITWPLLRLYGYGRDGAG